MAFRRLASSTTLSAGTKMNSAPLSTNFLMSHGQATRSTLTYSRVIHFKRRLLWTVVYRRGGPQSREAHDFGAMRARSWGPLSSRVDKYRGAMRLGQERIDF